MPCEALLRRPFGRWLAPLSPAPSNQAGREVRLTRPFCVLCVCPPSLVARAVRGSTRAVRTRSICGPPLDSLVDGECGPPGVTAAVYLSARKHESIHPCIACKQRNASEGGDISGSFPLDESCFSFLVGFLPRMVVAGVEEALR